ncbi:MAG: tetratricopeptide repeat protein [Chloroflexi bacterium]|nr:tetratricopeptide repeat protein [Chloroflexota bacterium]MCI0580194.1 tetratricopeptide repeat protein [Chloroflexota bacterium]MCI0646038.1 tetratricopeptide repeat protein [Chloroflexota bacterium]MCI0727380.1 tetratricopeptide repeat protein [Chloroflexota bacterium]
MVSESGADQLKEEGLRLFRQGQRQEALTRFEAAATAYGRAGDEASRGEMQNNLGVIYRLQGNWPAAVTALQQAEMAFASLGDEQRQAQALGNLGDLYAARKEREAAANCYGRSAELFARVGDGQKQAAVLRAYSLMRLRQGRWLEAILLMNQSLEAQPRLGLLQQLFRLLLRLAARLLGAR